MTPSPTPILIVADEDNAQTVDGTLRPRSDFTSTNIHPNLSTLTSLIQHRTFKIAVLTTTTHADFDWLRAIHELKHSMQHPGVVVLAEKPTTDDFLGAFMEGADAFFTPDAIGRLLISALVAIRNGMTAYRPTDMSVIRYHMRRIEPGGVYGSSVTQSGLSRLTEREREIFPMLADGLAVKDIARNLVLSPKTVEAHKYHIMKKLNLDKMSDLTKLAIRKMLISP